MVEKIFPKGLIVKRQENAPAFVIGSLSIKVDEFIEFLNQYKDNGWVNIDMAFAKESGKPYSALSTWKPNKQETDTQNEDFQNAPSTQPPVSKSEPW
ncbi:MAG: hypothetical protein GY861_13820 [bacterium]|nr:hypothetical protein [bacterium]